MCNQCNDSDQEHVHAEPSRREALITGAAMLIAPFLGGVTSAARTAQAQVPVRAELVHARQVLADKTVARNRSLHVMGHGVSRFIYVVAPEGSLVPILDVLIGWSICRVGDMSCTDMWPSRV